MRRILLISLSLSLAFLGWSPFCKAEFNVIPVMKGKFAPVAKTGQTVSYDLKDDGALQKGVACPTPRFIDNNNGTVTDKLTGLIWLKNAKCFNAFNWVSAISCAALVRDGYYGLTDGSQMGDWRLPNFRELQSLIDFSQTGPALPADHPFDNVQSSDYWSSTTLASDLMEAWMVSFDDGDLDAGNKTGVCHIWCVRGGK